MRGEIRRAYGNLAVWETLAETQKAKEDLEEARGNLERAQRDGDLAKAGEFAYGIIPGLERKLEDATENSDEGSRLLNQEVADDDVASVVSRWTGIPVEKMLEGEREKLLRMERVIGERVIGQEEAIIAVSNAGAAHAPDYRIQTGRSGLSFFSVRPVLEKPSSQSHWQHFYLTTRQLCIGSTCQNTWRSTSVARLIGAPPGYVGYEEGGALTEGVRRRPYQVVLFDEIEKAHPDVFNVLLQVLDDGRLTDGQGRTVDFRNTLIILTSNLGSEVLANQEEQENFDAVREQVMKVVRASFPPEFLNRLDETLLFQRLSREHMTRIVDIQLKQVRAMLAERKITLKLDDLALTWLAEAGYDPVYGARPLRRVIQRNLQSALATRILEGSIKDGDTVKVGSTNDGLEFKSAEAEQLAAE